MLVIPRVLVFRLLELRLNSSFQSCSSWTPTNREDRPHDPRSILINNPEGRLRGTRTVTWPFLLTRPQVFPPNQHRCLYHHPSKMAIHPNCQPLPLKPPRIYIRLLRVAKKCYQNLLAMSTISPTSGMKKISGCRGAMLSIGERLLLTMSG